MTSLADKKADTGTDPERVAPLVQVNCVHLNKAGSVWAQWSVRFPEGGTPDDLTRREIWSRIQNTLRPPIRRFDELRILAHDAGWLADCFVAHASDTALDLVVRSITKLPGQVERLFADERYEVRFVGKGYQVFRKSDDQPMKDATHSAAAAERDLRELYPKRV